MVYKDDGTVSNKQQIHNYKKLFSLYYNYNKKHLKYSDYKFTQETIDLKDLDGDQTTIFDDMMDNF